MNGRARVWRDGWYRHFGNDGLGAGVGMLAQYTDARRPELDSGLPDPWPAQVRRPVYEVLASLPRFD